MWHQSEGKAGFVEYSGAVFGATILLMMIVKGVTARVYFKCGTDTVFKRNRLKGE